MTASGAILQVVAILAPLYLAGVLIAKLGGGSLRAALWIGTPASVIVVLIASAFIRAGGGSWQKLGLAAPHWPKTIGLALATAVVVSVGIAVAQSLAVGLFGAAPPDTARFQELRGNLPLLLIAVLCVWISSALAEELVVRGFLLDRLMGLVGGGWWAAALAVVTSALIFGLGHAYQGMTGVIASSVAGVVYGCFYLVSGKNLWVTILAHAMLDTAGLVAIYASGSRDT